MYYKELGRHIIKFAQVEDIWSGRFTIAFEVSDVRTEA